MWQTQQRMRIHGSRAIMVGLCLLGVLQGRAQGNDRVEILNADRWVFDKEVATGAQRLLGNVRFRQEDATMACDSAYLYEDNRVTAFSRVVLNQGDTLRIHGDRLEYAGSNRVARMSGRVRLSDPGMELTTDALTYDVRAHQATYTTFARIENRRDGSTLTSRNGVYDAGRHVFDFTDSVRILHTDYSIRSDTVRYATSSGQADFIGPTWILQDDVRMYCERGSYTTGSGMGMFTKQGRILHGAQELTGDSLVHDRAKGIGRGWGHVVIKDTVQRLVIRGGQGLHRQADDHSMVTGHAELAMLMGADSLHLHGDTLFADQDLAGRRAVTARENVRFFKQDMQGVCDTMRYAHGDSLITLRGAPFLWNLGNQLSGDSIRIQLRNGQADQLHVEGHAFLTAQADSLHFDQITGTTLTGYFRHNELHRLIADGNSRSVYFAREVRDSVEQVTGVNRVDCSTISIGLDSGQVQTVSFITQPAATLFPLDKAPVEELRLDGFRWNAAARPQDQADIFRRTPPPPTAWGAAE